VPLLLPRREAGFGVAGKEKRSSFIRASGRERQVNLTIGEIETVLQNEREGGLNTYCLNLRERNPSNPQFVITNRNDNC
jgi:hypothetical protein